MKKVELESRIEAFIRRHNLILPGERIVIGVSGGADSVCLLHILTKWQGELGINLYAAHLNHQLRGAESDEDAGYVANLAASLGIPVTIGKRDVAAYRSKTNCPIEEAARELRYDFLAKVAANVGACKVAIGHTRDDQVETILMHILRGTGIRGLRGLEPCSSLPFCYSEPFASCHSECSCPIYWATVPDKSGNYNKLREESPKERSRGLLIIRPLLDITRQETLNYCQEHQLRPRVDSSNLSLSFLRNRLRLELLPLLRRYNPSVDQALLRLAKIAGDDSSFIEQQALQLWDEVSREENGAIHLDKEKVGSLPIALQSRVIRLAVDRVLGNTRDIEASHIEAIRSLLSKPAGKRISLPHGLVCHSGHDGIVLSLTSLLPCPFPLFQGEFPLKVPGETQLPGWRVIASIVRERMVEGHCEPFASCPPPNLSLGGRGRRRGCSCPIYWAAVPDKSGNYKRLCEESRSAQDRLREAISAEFDLHKTGTELFVRQRRAGDRFQPLGMNMSKKLQDFMVDAKIPALWRDRIPVVCSPQQIIWVVGWRMDDRVKITEATREVLRLEFIKSS